MAIKKSLRGITKGADLLKPQLSLGYILAAIVAVAVLLFVFAAGRWIYAKTGKVSQGLIPTAEMPDWEAKLGL